VKTCRYRAGGEERWGIVEGDRVRALSGEPWVGGLPEGKPLPLAEVTLLAPVRPSKVVCVGRNYAAHARELGHEVPKQPLLFLKPPSAVIGPGEEIRCPPGSSDVQHEAELAVVVGRALSRAGAAEARQAIFGYTCLNDVTARDIQREEKQFTRAKGFDTFCPVGPWIDTGLDPEALTVACRVNGEERQRGNTRDMIFDPAALLAFISSIMTLLPGDLVATGTPEGVSRMEPGDWVEVEISGLGLLRNPVS
jgi:2-keto-4-pentenoate hydratase/2-oxohepta-3-ene-1,7-dioic acid hydratase in catechol pathway